MQFSLSTISFYDRVPLRKYGFSLQMLLCEVGQPGPYALACRYIYYLFMNHPKTGLPIVYVK